MMRQYELVDRVRAYEPCVNEQLLNRAYVYAMKMHGDQTRASGDPYFSHPIEVAGILTALKLDTATIVTALLHDTLEDTKATYEEVQELFGEEIAKLVDGVTKLTRIELSSEDSKQAENFRKFLLAMSDDIRVLLVKLADRLHNMRTLHFIKKPEKRRRIAQETLDIYAPLAGRMGIQQFRDELEDLAFRELNPEARDTLVQRLMALRERSGDIVQRIEDQLGGKLAENGIKARVYGREKRAYSIWQKLARKSISLEQLSDLFGFRIIVENDEDCYRALGVVHRSWPIVPGRFKDYISTPKRNNYRSLHTTVIGPEKQRVELQIRTEDMHAVAERGVAAHWYYKESDDDPAEPYKVQEQNTRPYRWLQQLVELLEHGNSPEEFLEHTKLELFHDQVFCFTPKGDLIALPRGATVIDFAYAVHTDVGNTCVGCKVNGRHMPVQTRLRNGDEVEILRSKGQKPLPSWEAFATTGRARSAIRRFVRHKERDEFIHLGREITERAFTLEGRQFNEDILAKAFTKFSVNDADELYQRVGRGLIHGSEVVSAVYPRRRKKKVSVSNGANGAGGESAIPIRGLIPGLAVHMAECCRPIPGDRIVGIHVHGLGIVIHTIDCPALADALDQPPEAWIDVGWDIPHGEHVAATGRLVVTASNHVGTLAMLARTIADHEGNILDIRIRDRSPDFMEMQMDVEVQDNKHLSDIIAALRVTPVVSSVERGLGH